MIWSKIVYSDWLIIILILKVTKYKTVTLLLNTSFSLSVLYVSKQSIINYFICYVKQENKQALASKKQKK